MNLDQRIWALYRLRDFVASWTMALHQARYIASATIIGIILLLGWKDPEQPWMKMMFLAGGQHIAGMLIEFLLVRLYCRIEHRIAHLSGFLR